MVHPAEIRDTMGLPLHVVRALVRHGALVGARHVNPATRMPGLRIDRAAFDRFRADHVSLAELARARSVSPRLLMKRLSEVGIAPAVDQRLVGAVVFRKSNLPDLERLDLTVRVSKARRQ